VPKEYGGESGKRQHDLAEGGVGFEMFMGGTDFFDWVGPIDHRTNEATNNQWQHTRKLNANAGRCPESEAACA